MNTLPITYIPGVFSHKFEDVDAALIWEQRDAPRSEAYYAMKNIPYTYGAGAGVRTYFPHTPSKVKPANMASVFTPVLLDVWGVSTGTDVRSPEECHGAHELLFCNRYADQHQHLGWHADDSPSIDHNRSIVVVTFGAERDIWFTNMDENGKVPKGAPDTHKLRLGHGSVLVMHPGMQQTHMHRIPKHDRPCGPRISFTFRGLAPGIEEFVDVH